MRKHTKQVEVFDQSFVRYADERDFVRSVGDEDDRDHEYEGDGIYVYDRHGDFVEFATLEELKYLLAEITNLLR